MFKSLRLRNYRGFEDYTLSGLNRVNLLVGKNNCGKTSALECVHFLASAGNPTVFYDIALARGEVISTSEEQSPFGRRPLADVSHLFLGHTFDPGAEFSISSDDGLGTLSANVVSLAEGDYSMERQLPLFEGRAYIAPEYVLRIVLERGGETYTEDLPVADDGTLLMDPRDTRRSFRGASRYGPHHPIPVQLISPVSLQPSSMSEMWDNAVIEGREGEVVEVMQILEPELQSIHFLTSERAQRFARGGVLLGFSHRGPRVPLGSCGEGMRRLLALALSLIRSSGGFLLVDEIDTGLHWTIMEEMWHFIVKAAAQSNVQVFATTHSFDCIRGLAALLEDHQELGESVSLLKVDRNLNESIVLDSDKIRVAVEQDIEVR